MPPPRVLPRAAYLAAIAARHRRHQTWLMTRLAGRTDRPSIGELAIEYGVTWGVMFATIKRFQAEGGVLPPRARTWNVVLCPSKQDGISGWWVGTRQPRDGLWFADAREALAFKTHWQERRGKSPTLG